MANETLRRRIRVARNVYTVLRDVSSSSGKCIMNARTYSRVQKGCHWGLAAEDLEDVAMVQAQDQSCSETIKIVYECCGKAN